ncbi:hypothetical protein C8R43DRAFT_1161947 [Mycena crocata]|nr:hypothetical protein C8R43DRAFT_1161947 [Mycena crocata]
MSQRTLLRTLTLSCGNSCAVWELLEKSPHAATYFIHLVLYVPRRVVDSHKIEGLHRVLGLLRNVRRCVVDGSSLVGAPLSLDRTTILLEFLSKQSLRELHIRSLRKISPSILVRFLAVAPIVSFLCSVIGNPAEESWPTMPPNPHSDPPKIEGLVLDLDCATVSKWLVHPQFISYVGSLRQLSIMPNYASNNDLVEAAACTLQSLYLYCPGPKERVILLPPLPALRTLKMCIYFPRHDQSWLIDTLAILLNPKASPSLAFLTFKFLSLSLSRYPALPLLPDPALLTSLDHALAAYPATPVVRWRLDLSNAHAKVRLADLVVLFQSGMPKTHVKGRVLVESYVVDPGKRYLGRPYEGRSTYPG